MASDSRVIQLARALASDPRSASRSLARKAFFRAARHFTPVVAVDGAGVRLFVSTEEAFVSRQTFVTGGYEQETMSRLVSNLPERGREIAGRGVLEIGANIGTQTVAFLTDYRAGRVVAVEPAQDNLELLRLNLHANGLQDRAQVLALALSDSDGAGRLALSDSNPGDHRVAPGTGATSGRADRATVEITIARLDTLIDRGELDLDEIALVWMDAQGHEGHVLAGAGRLLASDTPILTEYWPHGLREAGGLERFHALVAAHYDGVLDLHTDDGRPAERIAAADLPGLAARRGWDRPDADADRAFTDLLLARTPRPPSPPA